ncbi:MAG TPA: hypothetical protein VKY90_20320 [Candidatus Dormibacteraeota bacterium]|nr:hypothetical protein [Candidatus Dormibacteraeota bacterium]
MARPQPSHAAGRERAFPFAPEAQDVAQAMGTWAGAFLAGLQADDDQGRSSPSPRPAELAFVTITEGAVLAGLLTRLGLETARWLGRGLLELAGPPATASPTGLVPPADGQGRPTPLGRATEGPRRRLVAEPPAPTGGAGERIPARRSVDVQPLSGILPLLVRAASPTPGKLVQVTGMAGRSLPTVLRGLQAVALARAAARDAVRERRPTSRR